MNTILAVGATTLHMVVPFRSASPEIAADSQMAIYQVNELRDFLPRGRYDAILYPGRWTNSTGGTSSLEVDLVHLVSLLGPGGVLHIDAESCCFSGTCQETGLADSGGRPVPNRAVLRGLEWEPVLTSGDLRAYRVRCPDPGVLDSELEDIGRAFSSAYLRSPDVYASYTEAKEWSRIADAVSNEIGAHLAECAWIMDIGAGLGHGIWALGKKARPTDLYWVEPVQEWSEKCVRELGWDVGIHGVVGGIEAIRCLPAGPGAIVSAWADGAPGDIVDLLRGRTDVAAIYLANWWSGDLMRVWPWTVALSWTKRCRTLLHCGFSFCRIPMIMDFGSVSMARTTLEHLFGENGRSWNKSTVEYEIMIGVRKPGAS